MGRTKSPLSLNKTIMENPNQALPLDDVDTFAAVVTKWHVNNLKTLHHTKAIPVGTEIQIGDDKPIVLKGALHRGFLMGIEASIAGIGDLPFFTSKNSSAPPVEAQSETALNEPA